MSNAIEFEDRGEIQAVRISGELTYLTANDLISAINVALKKGKRKFVLDFGPLDFIDSSGVGSLLLIRHSIQEAGGKMALAGVSESVKSALDQLQINRLIDAFPSVDGALEGMGG